MTRLQAFKNGRWVHSDTILAIAPDVNFYRVAAGTYAWADTTQPTTYIAADRGLALGVGVTPANWTHDAGAGITVTFRTQSAFAASGAQGGDFIIQAGLGDGVGRRGSFSVPGAGAGSEAFGLASSAVGANSLAVGNAAVALAANSVVIGAGAEDGTVAALRSVVIGRSAGSSANTGSDQVIIGFEAGNGLLGSGQNTILGASAGSTLTTGLSNCLIGYGAETQGVTTSSGVGIGVLSVVGFQSVAIGTSATANGATSVVIGHAAYGGTSAVTDVVVIGDNAANAAFTGIRNVLIGSSVASNLISGTLNTICGSDAGDLLTTGSSNSLFGFNCETSAVGTANSVGMGTVVLVGTDAVSLGANSIASSTSVTVGASATSQGANSVVIGYSADGGTAAATNGVVIGDNAANAAFTGIKNVLIGTSVATALTSGTLNTIVGSDAGDVLTIGSNNCLYGYNAETRDASSNNSVGIGYQCFVATRSVAIGSSAQASSDSATNGVVIGYVATIGAANTIAIGATATANAANSVVIGYSADGGTAAATNGVVIGDNAANTTFTGVSNVLIGSSVASALDTGTLNTIVGSDAGDVLTTGGSNVLIGFNAETAANSTSSSIGIGANCVTTNNSVSIGTTAICGGQTSVVIGVSASSVALANARQVLIGYSVASALSSGADNTIVGAEAGDVLTTGASNVLIGSDCETAANVSSNSVGVGASVIVATSSVALGTSANVSQTDSIGLGHNVATTASNQFVAGSNLQRINNVYFGKGVDNAAPTSYTINGTASTGAAAGGDLVIAGGVSTAGVGGSIRIQTAIGAGLADRQVVSPNGNFTFTQAINTTGSPTFALWTGAAHTTLTASVEAIDINFNLARTVEFTAGALTTQRAFVIQAPTYAFATGPSSTITTAATLAITGAPAVGTNAIITNSLAFWVQAGKSQFADHVTLLSDSAAVQFGAGTDMSVYYNGTNGIINTSLVAASDLTITCGAQKTFVLTNTVYNDANVGGATLRGGSTNPPITQIVDNVGTNTGIYALGFDVADEANGCIEIPHDYAEGTNLVFHVHWFGNTAPAGGTDNVKWQVTYSVCRDGVTTPPATTPAGTEVAYTTQYSHVRTDLATITGTNFKIGDQVQFNIKRIAASADDYAGVTLLDTVGFHYQCDTMGSRQATAK